jgi:hypothetical protein
MYQTRVRHKPRNPQSAEATPLQAQPGERPGLRVRRQTLGSTHRLGRPMCRPTSLHRSSSFLERRQIRPRTAWCSLPRSPRPSSRREDVPRRQDRAARSHPSVRPLRSLRHRRTLRRPWPGHRRPWRPHKELRWRRNETDGIVEGWHCPGGEGAYTRRLRTHSEPILSLGDRMPHPRDRPERREERSSWARLVCVG